MPELIPEGIEDAVLSLRTRATDPEFMDDQTFSREALAESFQFIKGVNLLGGGQRTVFNGLRQALKEHSIKSGLTVLDVGCGIGDLGRGVIRWGTRQGYDFRYVGLEPSEQSERKLHGGPTRRYFIGILT